MKEFSYHCHPRVKVDGLLVDEEMSELIRLVWEYGIRTVSCCQGGPNTPLVWAWIHFPEMVDGIKFIEGTCYLGNWRFADEIHMYLTHPVLPQAGPSPMVLINPVLLPEITKLWVDGTAKKPEKENKE